MLATFIGREPPTPRLKRELLGSQDWRHHFDLRRRCHAPALRHRCPETVGYRTSKTANSHSPDNMKKTFLLAITLAGCYPASLAPDYALGTYQWAVTGTSSCESRAAQLAVTIAKYSAFGDWYLEQQNVRTQFSCAWVNQVGFFSSYRPPGGHGICCWVLRKGWFCTWRKDRRGCLQLHR